MLPQADAMPKAMNAADLSSMTGMVLNPPWRSIAIINGALRLPGEVTAYFTPKAANAAAISLHPRLSLVIIIGCYGKSDFSCDPETTCLYGYVSPGQMLCWC